MSLDKSKSRLSLCPCQELRLDGKRTQGVGGFSPAPPSQKIHFFGAFCESRIGWCVHMFLVCPKVRSIGQLSQWWSFF